MDARLRELRQAISELPRRGRLGRRRYPEDLRKAVLAYVEGRRRGGETVYQLSRALGLSQTTLSKWIRQASSNGRSGFRPVAISGEAPEAVTSASSGAVLVTAQGHRVEGLTAAELLTVLRGLA